MAWFKVEFVQKYYNNFLKPELKTFLKKFGWTGLTTLKQFITELTALIERHFDNLIKITGFLGRILDKSNILDKLVVKFMKQGRDWLLEIIDELLLELPK